MPPRRIHPNGVRTSSWAGGTLVVRDGRAAGGAVERPLPRTVPNSNSAPGPGLVWSMPGSSREHDDHFT
jgi:hypothetical protein